MGETCQFCGGEVESPSHLVVNDRVYLEETSTCAGCGYDDEELLTWARENDSPRVDPTAIEQRLARTRRLPEGVSDEPVQVAEPADYSVDLCIDGLPPRTVSIDYYDGSPRIHIYDSEVAVDHRRDSEEPTTITIEPDER